MDETLRQILFALYDKDRRIGDLVAEREAATVELERLRARVAELEAAAAAPAAEASEEGARGR